MRIAGIVAAIILVIILTLMWFMGVFQRIEVNAIESGPMRMVYIEHKGSYDKIAEKINQVKLYLDKQKIAVLDAFGEYYDDPQKVKTEDLRSAGGFLVIKDIQPETSYKFKRIDKKLYASAIFIGSPAIGPFMVYPKLMKWIEKNHYEIDGAAIELYKMTEDKIETHYMIPIKSRER